jgi:hypothetical protein
LVFVGTLTLLFMLPILLIRAQPYESGHLAAFLIPPEDCPSPCFLGVRPRHTTIEQALVILRANELIEHVQVESYYEGQSIFWRWKDGESDFRRYAFRVNRNHVVERPILPYSLTLGEVHLLLGEPARVSAAMTNEYQPRGALMLDYPAYGLHLFIGLYPCEVNQREFWQTPHESSLYGSFFIGLGEASYARLLPNTRIELDPRAWAKQIREFCRVR